METIDIAEIKAELTRRAEQLYVHSDTKGLALLRELAERVKNADNFSMELTNILNQVLKEKAVEFKDEVEKEDFLKEIRPFCAELIRTYIKTR